MKNPKRIFFEACFLFLILVLFQIIEISFLGKLSYLFEGFTLVSIFFVFYTVKLRPVEFLWVLFFLALLGTSKFFYRKDVYISAIMTSALLIKFFFAHYEINKKSSFIPLLSCFHLFFLVIFWCFSYLKGESLSFFDYFSRSFFSLFGVAFLGWFFFPLIKFWEKQFHEDEESRRELVGGRG